ncbi:MAG: hypothetical protein M3340_02130 [Actinomycetota bacterium]|nr:hypothetical protein [Actinomycetota bacterium]
MNHSYADIREKLGEPQWWDENAVPRYCDFAPERCANIYALEAVLLEIACQDCGTPFLVAISRAEGAGMTLEQAVVASEIHYGDPPNAGCCGAGPTMNSVPRRVIEFWVRRRFEWFRSSDLERTIDCGWAA